MGHRKVPYFSDSIAREQFSVNYYDTNYRNLLSVVVSSHCGICAKHDGYSDSAAGYSFADVEPLPGVAA
jgi:hypothetical protein